MVTFEAIKGVKVNAISTAADLFVHIKSTRQDMCYEVATFIHDLLKEVTELIDETQGFRLYDGRAIISFVDGTENPAQGEVTGAAYISEEDPDYINRSYAFTQKYIHNMDYWNSLTTEE